MRAEFDESLVTGNEMIDSQHKELIGKIKLYIGDVRNPDSLRGVMRGVDYIFHAAAL